MSRRAHLRGWLAHCQPEAYGALVLGNSVAWLLMSLGAYGRHTALAIMLGVDGLALPLMALSVVVALVPSPTRSE